MLALAVCLAGGGRTDSAQPDPSDELHFDWPRASRQDLARSYIGFEQTMRANPLPADRIAPVNLEFDRATFLFFAGQSTAAIRIIDELAHSLRPAHERTDARRLLDAVRIRPAPRAAIAQAATDVFVTISSVYPLQLPLQTVQLHLSDAEGTVIASRRLEIDPADPAHGQWQPFADQPQPEPGEYHLHATAGQAASEPISVFIVDQPIDTLRQQLSDRVARARQQTPELAQAAIAVRARIELLQADPPEHDSTRFLAHPLQLMDELKMEVAALEAGRDPFYRRSGDYWRPVIAGRSRLPVRVFVPERAAGDQPRPLLIVIHGAGGDENMFLVGYGAGLIRELAQQHDMVVLSPFMPALWRSPGAFEALLRQAQQDYAIDPQRIYIIGHSMGGMLATRWASQHPDTIAAAVAVGGGGLLEGNPAPTLVIVGQLDRYAGNAQAAAARLQQRGAPVQTRQPADWGHALVLNPALPQAVEWLLQHRLDGEDGQ